MLLTSRSNGFGRLALAAALFVAGAAHASETLTVYDDEAAFLAAAPVVSTEGFDQFPREYYSVSEVTFDEVHYTIRSDWGPGQAWCALEEYFRCWGAGKRDNTADAPGTLDAIGNNQGAEGGYEWEAVTFGEGLAVNAIGFYVRGGIEFTSGPGVSWMQVTVAEIGGAVTLLYLPSEPREFVYLGLVSETGITAVEIKNESPEADPQYPASVYFVGFDDVSRSEIIPAYSEVNPYVSFQPDPSSFVSSRDTTGCPAGCVGTFRFTAMLSNISEHALANLHVEIAKLTRGNRLVSDEGLLAAGDVMPVPRTGDYADGELAAAEWMDMPFTVCLQSRKPFRFRVNVLGTMPGG